jgi:hypothetical protein
LAISSFSDLVEPAAAGFALSQGRLPVETVRAGSGISFDRQPAASLHGLE